MAYLRWQFAACLQTGDTATVTSFCRLCNEVGLIIIIIVTIIIIIISLLIKNTEEHTVLQQKRAGQ